MSKKKKSELTITEEEIANNHIVKSSKSYILVFGILFMTIFLLLVGGLFKTNITPDYPIVFKDANNHLMVITKSSNGKKDIVSVEDTDIVYANEDIRYLLYINNNNLYLLDTTTGNEGTLLEENVLSYGFSSDDKYIYYINSNKELYVYIRKSSSKILIDTEVTKAYDVVDDYVVYDKNESLIVKDYEKGTTDTVSKEYKDVLVSEDRKSILYSIMNSDKSYNYYLYTFQNLNNEKVLSDIQKILSYNDSFTSFIYLKSTSDELNIYNELEDSLKEEDKKFVAYTEEDVKNGTITSEELKENKEQAELINVRNECREYARNYITNGYDIFYKYKETTTQLAKGINKVYLNNISDRKIVYTKSSWTTNINISDYTSLEDFKKALESRKTNALYYQVDTNQSSIVSNEVDDDLVVTYVKGDGIYYLQNNELYYSSVSGKKAKTSTLVDKYVISKKLDQESSLGLVYLTGSEDNNSLKYVSNGKYKIINENVYNEYWKVAESEDAIYYLKDYSNNSGTLMIFNGIRNSKISENVSRFLYINDEVMYLTLNYNEQTKTSDLYRLNNSKLELIYEGISEWYNPLEEKEVETE